LKSKCPTGPIETRWERHQFELKLVNPANKRKFNVIMVGSGLAGGSAAASMAELGYNVKCFCFQDTPRRAHSIAAQGASTPRRIIKMTATASFVSSTTQSKAATSGLANRTCTVLAQISVNIIDQCVAQGVPFAREYGGTLANRSFGGAQVSRTFYARGQTGQQLLIGAYQALERQIGMAR